MLAHAAYFEALSSISDDASPEWKATTAGLVVLRLVDAWLDLGAHVVTTDVTGLRAVRIAVTDVPGGDPVRSLLMGVVDTLEQSETATIQLISSNLFAYGQALHYAGQWNLAQDVFLSIVERAQKIGDHKLTVAAALERALNLRKLGNLEAADKIYLAMLREAKVAGDAAGYMRSRLGRIQVVEARGDLPTAATMLDELLAVSDPMAIPEIHGRILHMAAYVAAQRGNHAAAVRSAYHALEFTTDPVARDRIMVQIAISFAHLGHLAASRDANLLLASTAQEQEMRWSALTNLMYVAILEGHEPAFEYYRHLLAREHLPARIEVAYRVDAARGFLQFGRTDSITSELTRARDIAERHALNQQIFEIDAVLTGKDPLCPIQKPVVTASWPTDIDSIASTIGEWRQLQETMTQTRAGAVL